jgi:hypothetical protein
VAGRGLRRGEDPLGLLQRRRDGLLDQDVLAGLERGDGEPAVLGHAGEDQDEIDGVVGADGEVGRDVRAEAEPLAGGDPLVGARVVDRGHLDAALALQPLDQAHVRRPEDAAQPDDPQPDAHVALRAVS